MAAQCLDPTGPIPHCPRSHAWVLQADEMRQQLAASKLESKARSAAAAAATVRSYETSFYKTTLEAAKEFEEMDEVLGQ